jgi:dihydrofolate synthase/folylpolyglutamate synthase
MTYEEAMQLWFGRVNYEQKSPQVGDFKLDRMRHLLELLGNPHRRLRIVHIAGSKGKGSTSAMLGSILRHEGYRVGLFTSPHLVAVEERIQVDRDPIAREELTALLLEIRTATPEAFLQELTFFEIGTAVGFLHFVRRRVDFAIIEVGLGGRFDSTNVCEPLLSIITSISFDHTQILGDTLAKIAYEKAGIIKPLRPTISGVRNREARQVIEAICLERRSRLHQVDVDFGYTHVPACIDTARERWPTVQVTTQRRAWPALTLGLIGEHQAANAAVTIAAVEELMGQGVPIRASAVADGLASVVWPARLEILSRRPLVLLDCAHNVASARALVQALETSFPLDTKEQGRRFLIFGGNRDKDLTGMLELLAPCFQRIYMTSSHGTTRCLAPEQLVSLLPEGKRAASIECAESSEAWHRARAEAKPNDLICIAGSVFLAGELRPIIMAPTAGS